MKKVTIYTDGACSGNPGPGGWGAILMYKGAKKEISGGMKQRVAIIRSLLNHTPVLLMDEPLSALDDTTRSIMQQLIIDVHKQTNNTIIMVTHSKEEANKMCDVIIEL